MTPEELDHTAVAERERAAKVPHTVGVCLAAGCLSARSDQVLTALQGEAKAKGVAEKVCVKGVGCLGLCSLGPLVAVEPGGTLLQGVTPPDAPEILASVGKRPPARLALPTNTPFFTRQKKIVLENCGVIDPERIEEYLAAGGYAAQVKVLTAMRAEEVIAEVVKSGLRGRGGAGYPTGLKWTTVQKARGPAKYVVCNADEGDPGAFMDRSVLESDPHRVLEGMVIAAFAVGASKGYIYVRAEYPLAVKRLKTAIRQAERAGLLGASVCGTTFAFTVELRLGAGAFVCGEETALLASIEGQRGTPRPRPPFPASNGLWNSPTLINNVETYANIPPIIRNGGEWFANIGTEKSKGTKVFALAGRIKNTGLIEVEMGTTLRDIIFEIGGGIPDGRKFKAVQTGGPSGGCIPDRFLDMGVEYESLKSAGSHMGSGGMIVMDESSCMVDVSRYFMEFCMSESCGKCVPCRAGTAQMHELLRRITEGRAGADTIPRLEELAGMVQRTSLCGLGIGAPSPTLTTLKYFRDEYAAHLEEHRCPAGVCTHVGSGAAVPGGRGANGRTA